MMNPSYKRFRNIFRLVLTGIVFGFVFAFIAFIRYAPALQSNEELLVAWQSETEQLMKDKYMLYIFERNPDSNDPTFSQFIMPLAIRAYAQTGQVEKFEALVKSFLANAKNEQTLFLYLKSWNEALIKNQQYRASANLLKKFELLIPDDRFDSVLEREKIRLVKACPNCFTGS